MSKVVLFYLVVLIVLAAAPPANAQEMFTATWAGVPLFIPDEDADVTSAGLLFVPQAFQIMDVNVQVNIQHAKIKDLTVDLISPEGTEIKLADRVCDTHGHFEDTVFDDEAGAAIGSVCPPGAGSFVPEDRLAAFDDENSFGTWALRIRDHEQNGFVGFLMTYSITFTAVRLTEPTIAEEGVISDATRLPGPVAPGELVPIVGAALGPNEPVRGEPDPGTGALPTELGGVRVTIDGRDAPLFLASLRKVTLQVPWDVPPGEFVPVQTFFGGQQSNVLMIPVHNTTPGVYTLDRSGRGHAKVINQDGTVNSPANPAAPGSVIVVYATGLGEVAPSVETGKPAPVDELSSAVFPVTAAIGNAEAQVLFAGLAPGLNVYQLNILVPESARAQDSARLVIGSDGKASRIRVWVAIN